MVSELVADATEMPLTFMDIAVDEPVSAATGNKQPVTSRITARSLEKDFFMVLDISVGAPPPKQGMCTPTPLASQDRISAFRADWRIFSPMWHGHPAHVRRFFQPHGQDARATRNPTRGTPAPQIRTDKRRRAGQIPASRKCPARTATTGFNPAPPFSRCLSSRAPGDKAPCRFTPLNAPSWQSSRFTWCSSRGRWARCTCGARV